MKQKLTNKHQFLKNGLIALFLILSLSNSLLAQRKVVLILGASNAVGTGYDIDLKNNRSALNKYAAVNCGSLVQPSSFTFNTTTNPSTVSSTPHLSSILTTQYNNYATKTMVYSDSDGELLNKTFEGLPNGRQGFSPVEPGAIPGPNTYRHGLEVGLAKMLASFSSNTNGSDLGIIKITLSGTQMTAGPNPWLTPVNNNWLVNGKINDFYTQKFLMELKVLKLIILLL